MVKQFPVRYGRNYKVVLAIVLPGLLTIPFILWMQKYPNLAEWEIWLFIISFLGVIISTSLWLSMRVYPPCIFSINNQVVSLSFSRRNLLSPSDFSFNVADITSFTRGEIRGDEYFVFEIQQPACKFQVSAYAYTVESKLSFNEAMVEISELVNAVGK